MFNGTALISGGSSGIGLALAARLLEGGANVAIFGRSMDRLEGAIASLRPDSSRFLAVQADVTIRSQVQHAIEQTVGKFGRVDALINSAGVGSLGPFPEPDDALVDRVLDTNVKGVYTASQEVWKVMSAQKAGHIVNLCGILGVKALANAALYCASKHAVVGMGAALSLEGKRLGIRVTNICCTGVDSAFWEGVPGKPRAEMLLTPTEVATAISDLMALPAHVTPTQLVLQHVAHQM